MYSTCLHAGWFTLKVPNELIQKVCAKDGEESPDL